MESSESVKEEIWKRVKQAQSRGFTIAPGGAYETSLARLCVLGAVLLGEVHNGTFVTSAARILGIEYEEAAAIEAGFEGWSTVPTNPYCGSHYARLGQEIAERLRNERGAS